MYTLGFHVSRASIALSKALNASITANNIDLPNSQYVVLRCLYFKDGISQFDIANLLSKDAAVIKRTVDELEKKKLVVRKQVRTLKNSICITEKGRKLMPQVLEIAQNVIDKALNGIEKENQELLQMMLSKICANLEGNNS
jgi:DNA-binding MarR family transcriptional regulator